MINQDRLTKTFLRLAAIDSPSFGERQMADRLITELSALGISAAEDDSMMGENGAGNLFARVPGSLVGDPLLFCAHMDTVEPALHKQPQLHEDGRITSDGSTVLGADDVAGLAAILEALTVLNEDGIPHKSLELLFTFAEEPYCRGSATFDFGTVQAREGYVLDLEGPIGRAAFAAPTICAFTAEMRGKAAHAGFAPEDGIHAIAAAAKAVSRLRLGHIDEETTLNIGLIEGGTATNIVPDRCVVRGEIRSFHHETAERALEAVKEEFTCTAVEFGAECRLDSNYCCQAYEIDCAHPIISRYKEACGKAGVEVLLCKTFGGSDASQFALHGISGLVIANAMFKAHSCAEYTTVRDLFKVSEITLNLMTSME